MYGLCKLKREECSVCIMRGITYAVTCIYDVIYKAVHRLFMSVAVTCNCSSSDYILIYTVGLGAGLACSQYTTAQTRNV